MTTTVLLDGTLQRDLLLFDHANHRAQHLLQRCGVGWQVRKIDLHDRRMITTIASPVMNPA